MEKEMFSPMAIDALGEMMNISLGSSATAVSNMLDHRVDITTPTVSVVDVKDFSLGNLEPAIGVEIKYVEGLEGSNIMLLKRSDIKIIVDILMGMETPDEEFELNELTISCVCEVMNQMMGSAATAMSDFLGFRVDISTPQSFELDNLEQFKRDHLPQGADQIVVVRFFLRIENALESEFMNVMSVSLAKELLKSLGLEGEVTGGAAAPAAEPAPAPAPQPAPAPAAQPSGGDHKMSQEEIEAMLAGGAPAAAPEPEPAGDNHKMSQAEIEAMLAGMNGEPAPAPAPAPEPSGDNHKMIQAEIEAMLAGMNSEPAPPPPPQPAPGPAPAPAPAPAAQAPQQPVPPAAPAVQPGQMPPYPPEPMPGADGQMQGGYMGYPPMYYPPYPYPYPPQQPEAAVQKAAEPKVIATKPVRMEEMDPMERLGKEQAQNLDLIMEVPLQVTVEIGRARRKVQDILEFAKGSLVVLDKLAGDQVDLFVNGKCIARGDVVVIDDNFGIRVTEIIKRPDIEDITGK